MAEVKEMTIPLRAAWNVPRNRRANRAIAEAVNHAIWTRGMQHPPRKIRVVCTREEGFPIEVKLLEA